MTIFTQRSSSPEATLCAHNSPVATQALSLSTVVAGLQRALRLRRQAEHGRLPRRRLGPRTDLKPAERVAAALQSASQLSPPVPGRWVVISGGTIRGSPRRSGSASKWYCPLW